MFYIMGAPLNGVLYNGAPSNGVLYNGCTIKWCLIGRLAFLVMVPRTSPPRSRPGPAAPADSRAARATAEQARHPSARAAPGSPPAVGYAWLRNSLILYNGALLNAVLYHGAPLNGVLYNGIVSVVR